MRPSNFTNELKTIMKCSSIVVKLQLMFILIMGSPTTLAHHEISTDIDLAQFVDLQGTIERVEWINPHVVIHVSVETESGLSQLWLIQADTPNTLLRRGINRNVLETWSQISFRAYPSTSAPCASTCLSYGYGFTNQYQRTFILHKHLHEIVNELRID